MKPLQFEYTNHRGETAIRSVDASTVAIIWGSSEWHPEEQWILRGWDTEKMAMRHFALKDVKRFLP